MIAQKLRNLVSIVNPPFLIALGSMMASVFSSFSVSGGRTRDIGSVGVSIDVRIFPILRGPSGGGGMSHVGE